MRPLMAFLDRYCIKRPLLRADSGSGGVKRLFALVIGLLMLSVPLPAFAQYEELLALEEWKPSPQAEKWMTDIAACMVARQRERAQMVVLSDPVSPDANVKMADFLGHADICARHSLVSFKMHNPVLRGAIAERLYLSTFPKPPALAGLTPSSEAAGSGSPGALLYEIGRCAAARAPVVADRLVRAPRRSAAEAAAGKLLAPVLNACAHGAKAEFSGAMIHAVLAEGLYKLRIGDATKRGALD